MSRAEWLAVVIIVTAVAAVGGFIVGRSHPTTTERIGDAFSAEGAISVESEGITYGIPLDVMWLDQQGSLHDAGRPECLPPTGATVSRLRFATVDATVDGTSWQPVVWVSCQLDVQFGSR